MFMLLPNFARHCDVIPLRHHCVHPCAVTPAASSERRGGAVTVRCESAVRAEQSRFMDDSLSSVPPLMAAQA
ncbi:hypothetical protein VZT92_016237 [Zoarces viviparus]|uniref:Uncharacterized protein n=1 Tax=Zoarces viviparus TaxID=48416 RepID=A0AAW1ES52_ZOAVI